MHPPNTAVKTGTGSKQFCSFDKARRQGGDGLTPREFYECMYARLRGPTPGRSSLKRRANHLPVFAADAPVVVRRMKAVRLRTFICGFSPAECSYDMIRYRRCLSHTLAILGAWSLNSIDHDQSRSYSSRVPRLSEPLPPHSKYFPLACVRRYHPPS